MYICIVYLSTQTQLETGADVIHKNQYLNLCEQML